MKTALSVCIITKNEAANIKRCLKSMDWAEHRIVVDSGSTDETVAVARSLGATVIINEWPGWAKQKNFAVDQAPTEWVLSLDADEWLESGAEKDIRAAIANDSVDAYFLPRKTFFLGQWMAHAGWYPDAQIRLYKKSATRFSDVPVHEKVETPERHSMLDLPILHESYVSLDQFIAKNNAYSTAQAKQQKDQGQLWFKLFAKPAYRFIQTYLFQAGFLDGPRGFVLAVLRSWYEFIVIAKILFA